MYVLEVVCMCDGDGGGGRENLAFATFHWRGQHKGLLRNCTIWIYPFATLFHDLANHFMTPILQKVACYHPITDRVVTKSAITPPACHHSE